MTSEVVAAAPVPVPGRARRVREIAEELRGLRGALIPILHAVQEEFGYVDQPDVAGDRRRTEPRGRRGARRRHVLQGLPAYGGRTHHRRDLPGGGVPLGRRGRTRRARETHGRLWVRRDDVRRPRHPRRDATASATAPWAQPSRSAANSTAESPQPAWTLSSGRPDDGASVSYRATRPLALSERTRSPSGSPRPAVRVEIVRNGSRGMLWLEPWSRWRRPRDGWGTDLLRRRMWTGWLPPGCCPVVATRSGSSRSCRG